MTLSLVGRTYLGDVSTFSSSWERWQRWRIKVLSESLDRRAFCVEVRHPRTGEFYDYQILTRDEVRRGIKYGASQKVGDRAA